VLLPSLVFSSHKPSKSHTKVIQAFGSRLKADWQSKRATQGKCGADRPDCHQDIVKQCILENNEFGERAKLRNLSASTGENSETGEESG
jgi:hypothetical protein